MTRTQVSENLSLSRIIHGHWRLLDWNLNAGQTLDLTNRIIDLGVTSFDHADIYGNYECEAFFGQALKLNPGVREKIEIITKTGIALNTDKFPDRKIKYYDYSEAYIISSVENSLRNFGTDRIELFLLHRPSPFFNPEEVASAFAKLKSQGKVLNFGVSNFTEGQFRMLSAFVEEPLVTNQLELSPYCLEHFESGNLDFLISQGVKPMAWSPLAGGSLLHPQDEKGVRVHAELEEITAEIGASGIDQTIYAWLMKHPAGIMPVVGTGKFERIKAAVHASDLHMSLEQWFRIYNASTGVELP